MLVALLVVACGDQGSPTGTGNVRLVTRATPDTVRFTVPVVAHPCTESQGVLIHGTREGQGVLIWLRGWTSDTATFPLLSRGDSTAPRGAIATVRFLAREVPHGLTLDNGSVTVSGSHPSFAVRVRGTGVEASNAEQRTGELLLDRVPLVADSVSCRVQL